MSGSTPLHYFILTLLGGMNLLWVRVRSWALCQHPAAISHVSTDACTFMCIPSPDLANSSPCSQAFCCKFQELNAHFTTSLHCCQRCFLVLSQGALPCTLPHPDPLSVLPPCALAPTRYSSLWLKHSAPSKVVIVGKLKVLLHSHCCHISLFNSLY